jgi:hypothetical protein
MLRKITTYLSLALLLLTSAVPMPGMTPTPQAEAWLSAAMWTHGTSVQTWLGNGIGMTRYGYYTRVDYGKSGAATWFHFAIPTPVGLSNVRQKIDKVMLQFETYGATVTNVHIYDGQNLLKEHNNLKLSGNWDFAEFDVPGKPEVFRGIGISVAVALGNGSPRYILFKAAGADFL